MATGAANAASSPRPPLRLRRSATPPERRRSRQPSGALFGCANWCTFRLRLTHHHQLLDEPVGRAAAQRAVEAHVGPLGEPAVELLLVVELTDERAAGLEARLHKALQPLDDARRLRIVRLEETPRAAYLAAQGD